MSGKTHFFSAREHDLVVFPTVYLELSWVGRMSNHKIIGCECTRAIHLTIRYGRAIGVRFLRAPESRSRGAP